MRWMTFTTDGSPDERVGVVDGAEVLALPVGARLIDLLGEGDGARLRAAGEAARSSPADRFALDALRPLAPIPEPPAVRDFIAVAQHRQSSARRRGIKIPDVWYRLPVFYFSNPAALFGAYEDIEIPPGCQWFDFELEVGCVIGREARDVAAADALDYIAGYTIFCEWSARALQVEEMAVGLGPAKGKDSATSLGPVLVTPDELADVRTQTGYDLGMRVLLNGEPVGEDRWSNVHFSFEQMIERASRGTRLRPGEVLGSGTCGAGCLAELRENRPDLGWLREGDVVRLEIDRLGHIESRIVATGTRSAAGASAACASAAAGEL